MPYFLGLAPQSTESSRIYRNFDTDTPRITSNTQFGLTGKLVSVLSLRHSGITEQEFKDGMSFTVNTEDDVDLIDDDAVGQNLDDFQSDTDVLLDAEAGTIISKQKRIIRQDNGIIVIKPANYDELNQYDTDQDGVLSQAEIDAANQPALDARADLFNDADTDDDGVLSQDEIDAHNTAAEAHNLANDVQEITLVEFVEANKDILQGTDNAYNAAVRIDTNGDMVISREEIEAAYAMAAGGDLECTKEEFIRYMEMLIN